jgi:cytochrome c oxidase subunit 2
MGLWVYADTPGEFRRWLARQSQPAAEPSGSQASTGRDAFLDGACASCHTIRGTSASGDVGPDLTHLAGRATIGALALPNDRTALCEWIERSQSYKPGNQMPDFPKLGSTQLDALVAYLEGLK